MNTLLIDLHHYNRWANEKVCKLCDGLSDEQLDEPREIGFGTLRNTLFHILTVEEVWFDRWHAVPPKPFPTLAVAEAPGMVLHWNREFISRCFQYGDWATEQLIRQIKQLSDSQLDHDFQMGPGTIRKTLSHLFDSEKFWLNNWTTGKRNFVHSPPDISIDVIETQLSEVRAVRHRFLEECTDADSHRILQACFGGPIFHAQVIETCLQLLGHGTHHRAQLVNMLRRSGHTPASVDYVVWLRSNAK
jgi:uncharacterized damage-inducible protein DinB